MAVKTVSINVHGHRIDLAAYGEKFIGDDDYMAFGDDEDVTARWDGTNLKFMPLTDDAGAITVGDGTTNMDVIFNAGSSGKFHWDQSANVLYVIATTLMGYGSQFQFTPGGTGAGTGISFYNTDQYIRSVAANVLQISAGAYIDMAVKVRCAGLLQLGLGVSPAARGDLNLASDNRLEYGTSAAGATTSRVPMYPVLAALGDVVLPTGVGLQLGDKLRLQVSAAAATVLGEFYLDSGDSLLTYSIGGGVEYKAAILDGDGKLRIPVSAVAADAAAGQFYYSTSTGLLTLYNGAAEYTLPMIDTTATKRLGLLGPIRLFGTVAPFTSKGDLWLNTLNNKLHYYNGTTQKTIATE